MKEKSEHAPFHRQNSLDRNMSHMKTRANSQLSWRKCLRRWEVAHQTCFPTHKLPYRTPAPCTYCCSTWSGGHRSNLERIQDHRKAWQQAPPHHDLRNKRILDRRPYSEVRAFPLQPVQTRELFVGEPAGRRRSANEICVYLSGIGTRSRARISIFAEVKSSLSAK